MMSTASSRQGVENNGARLFFESCGFRVSSNREKMAMWEILIDERTFSPLNLVKHSRFLREVVDIQSKPLHSLVSLPLEDFQGSIPTQATP